MKCKKGVCVLLSACMISSMCYNNVFAYNDIGEEGLKALGNLNSSIYSVAESGIFKDMHISSDMPNFNVSWSCTNPLATFQIRKSYDGVNFELVSNNYSGSSISINESKFTSAIPYYAVEVTPILNNIPVSEDKVVIEYGNKDTDAPYVISFTQSSNYSNLDPIYKYKDGLIRQPIPFPQSTSDTDVFTGWYIDSGLNTKFTPSTNISANTILYPKFEKADTTYKVEVYTESEVPGVYTMTSTNRPGKRGVTVTEDIKPPTGYYYDSTYPGSVSSIIVGSSGNVLKTYYTRNTYSVKFDSLGGSNIPSQLVKYGMKLNTTSIPTKNGLAFDGWFLNKNFSKEFNFNSDIVTSNLTLYAKWVNPEDARYYYNVEYYVEGLDNKYVLHSKDQLKSTFGSTVIANPKSIEGFSFNSTNLSNVTSGIVTKDNSLTLKLYYTRNSYLVNFYTNGATNNIPSVTVKYGNTVSNPGTSLTRNGYVFRGWSLDNKNIYDFSLPIKNNINLYAMWEKVINYNEVKYTVEYYGENLNGRYVLIDSEEITGEIGDKISLKAKEIEGYEYDSGNSNNITSGTLEEGKSNIYELYYDRIKYKVEVDTDGDGELDEDVTAMYDEEYYDFLPEHDDPEEGYGFVGWFTQDKGKGKKINSDSVINKDYNYSKIYAYYEEGYEEEYYDDFDGNLKIQITVPSNSDIKVSGFKKAISEYMDGNSTYRKLLNNDTVITVKCKVYEYNKDNITSTNKEEYTSLIKDGVGQIIRVDITASYENNKGKDVTDTICNLGNKFTITSDIKDIGYTLYYNENDFTKYTTISSNGTNGIKLSKTSDDLCLITTEHCGYYTLSTNKVNFQDVTANTNNNGVINDNNIKGGIIVNPSFAIDVSTSKVDDVSNNKVLVKFKVKSGCNSYKVFYGNELIPGNKIINNELLLNNVDDKSVLNVEQFCSSNMFNDVKTTNWFHDAVDYVVSKGYLSGYDDNTFKPNKTITRAEMAQILYNYTKTDNMKSNHTNPGYSDVSSDKWYYNAVAYCKDNNLMTGDSNKFRPNDVLSREEVSSIIYRLNDYMKNVGVWQKAEIKGNKSSINSSVFVDGNQVTWSKESIDWALSYGLINGISNNYLQPRGSATRVQVANILMNFDNSLSKL